jgi:polysaccharide pyruvyl transferase WcaK-like protein
MRNILSLCEQHNIEITHKFPYNKTTQFHGLLPQLSEPHLVLINGEGTMHHDRPAGLALGEAAAAAKRHGHKIVLFNTVWEANQRLNNFLPFFDLIFCRESLSQQQIIDAGFMAETVPDMVFASPRPPRPKYPSEDTAVIDSVSRSLSRRLAWYSIRKGFRFLPLSQANFDYFSRNRLFRYLLNARSHHTLYHWQEDLPAMLSHYRHTISGRFHGTCLSLLAGTPVASIASNTHKIQGLYRDMGLNEFLIHPAEEPLSQTYLTRQFEDQANNHKSLEHYIDTAANRIQVMFTTIGSYLQST